MTHTKSKGPRQKSRPAPGKPCVRAAGRNSTSGAPGAGVSGSGRLKRQHLRRAQVRLKHQGCVTRRGSPCVFLDRDGTLIHDRPGFYLTHPEQIRYYAGTIAGLKLLKSHGFKLVIVSNQSGVGRGYLTEKSLKQIHSLIRNRLASEGAQLDGIYYCPHNPQENCRCRKPKPALALKAAREMGLSISDSFLIGDKKVDMDLGRNLNLPSVLVLTGHGRAEVRLHGRRLKADHVARNLLDAARWIITNKKQRKRSNRSKKT